MQEVRPAEVEAGTSIVLHFAMNKPRRLFFNSTRRLSNPACRFRCACGRRKDKKSKQCITCWELIKPPVIVPSCHPDRKHYGRGFCKPCWARHFERSPCQICGAYGLGNAIRKGVCRDCRIDQWVATGAQRIVRPDLPVPCLEVSVPHQKGNGGYPRVGNIRIARYIVERALGCSLGSLVTRHICDNPACIEETHLTYGTHLDNVRDAVERNRWAAAWDRRRNKTRVA